MFSGEAGVPVAIVVALDDDVGKNVGVSCRVELSAGIGREAADAGSGFCDALDIGAKSPGDLRMALAGEILKVIADNFVFDRVPAGRALQLQQK